LGAGWGLVPEDFNPCRAVEKFPERSRERFLTDAEFTRLGRVLDETVESDAVPLAAVTAIRLLMLTGCRKNEILTLRWSDVDLDAGELHLADSRTGPRAVLLPPTAVELLEVLPRRKDSPWVFPGNDRDGRYSGGGLDHAWRTVRAVAVLQLCGPGWHARPIVSSSRLPSCSTVWTCPIMSAHSSFAVDSSKANTKGSLEESGFYYCIFAQTLLSHNVYMNGSWSP